MFPYKYLFLTHIILCLTLFNKSKTEQFINSYNFFKELSCRQNNIHFNNGTVIQLNFKSKLKIDCNFTFKYSNECFNESTNSSNKSQLDCHDITLDLIQPKDLESDRFKIKTETEFYKFNNKSVNDIIIDVLSVGKKNNGQYFIKVKVKEAKASKVDYYLGISFAIEITDLGNNSDSCLYSDQCFSNICRNAKCICSKESPVSHDGNCLKNSKLLESCYVTEQCQFGDNYQTICTNSKGNKTCQCLPQYILLESSQPKCLSAKHYNQSCELSEECQSFDENSFCSAHRRCQCTPKHSIDKNNECTKTEVSNKFPYVLIFSTISGLITIVISIALFYKCYFVKRLNSKKENKLKQNSLELQKLKKNSQNDNQKENKQKSLGIRLTSNKSSNDDISAENENIYDDIAEIRYVTNQKKAINYKIEK